MKYRDLAARLWAEGCTTKPGTVSPGVVAQAARNLSCLPEGWLQ